jgi:hypothetical protein
LQFHHLIYNRNLFKQSYFMKITIYHISTKYKFLLQNLINTQIQSFVMRVSLYCFLLLSSLFTSGQAIKPIDLVNSVNTPFINSSIFTTSNRSSSNIPSEIKKFDLLDLNKSSITRLLLTKEKAINISLPSSSRSTMNLKLVEIEMPYFDVEAAPSGRKIKYQNGKHYRGIVEGQEKSLVALSIFEDEVMGLISEERSSSHMVIGKLEGSEKHIVYDDVQIKDKQNFDCHTADNQKVLNPADFMGGSSSRALTDCVGLYFELDNDLVTSKGGEVGATNYITAVFNQMAILYANENINVRISKVVAWTSTSPYASMSNPGALLNQFTTTRNGFDGDLGMLVGLRGNGGIAYVDGLCSFNKDFSSGYSGMSSTYANVPTYSWSVNILAHEFGHLFGSPHTHACAWNGNNTPLDGCQAPESNCTRPSGFPANGGTIMSYCHVTTAGINFQNGFGTQPGNLMRSRVAAASCLSACPGTGGGGTSGSTCSTNSVTLTLTFDSYPGETTWSIKNSSGAILYAGGPYNSPGATVNEAFCLPNACYTFEIKDAYGDGICCSYGQGSYKLTSGSSTMISGGQFNTVETKQFCPSSGGTSTPTCTDGIKNGQETGVDCGGPTCAPCIVAPTCTDGIKNGQETGVDCGGPTCAPCIVAPTCTDGIKNGQETGIDCGGPTCAPCSTTPSCINGSLNITLDVYPGETTWRILSTTGTVLYSGGPYSVSYGTVSVPICLTAGTCYNFEIKDAYGDGICCSYGNGSYKIVFNNANIITGGQFGAIETKQFCVPGSGGGTTATCTDGIKNGQETGIDCGGLTCAPCAVAPTCTDGIKNGQETGVDCGGPTCAPCVVAPTCTDGIKNGQETGVDCGGPTCAPCAVAPTCTDGIKNGQETGVDCGGPTCAPCNTSTACINGSLVLTLDIYPTETTWRILNATGTVMFSGGPYFSSSTVTVPICLQAGICYTFEIKDAYGDGICCSNGNGNYKVIFNNATLITGGQFTSIEAKQFCVPTSGGGTSTATCTDGIKNGSETGIDCGGSACAPCAIAPTCTDGIKNGQETGIDCGGPTCGPCSTGGGGSSNQLFGSYFETGWDNWTSGGVNCDRYQGNVAHEGNFSIRLRNAASPSSTMSSPIVNLTPYNTATLKFFFYPYSMEENEGFTVEYFNGSTWILLTRLISVVHFQNYNFYNAEITVNKSNTAFPSNARFRITSDASSNADMVFIDETVLTASTGSSLIGSKEHEVVISNAGLNNARVAHKQIIYPNPTTGEVNIALESIEIGDGEDMKIEVYDMLGRKVRSYQQSKDLINTIQLGDVIQGTYHIRISTKDEVIMNTRVQVVR